MDMNDGSLHLVHIGNKLCPDNAGGENFPAGYAVGYSSFILAEMRVALLASRALRLNLTGSLPADYAQLTLAEGFYLATMGGAQGSYTYILSNLSSEFLFLSSMCECIK